MLDKGFIILCIAFLVQSASLSCGPESCSNLSTVKLCDNVKACISDVWLKKEPVKVSDNVCKICVEMVKEARDQLQSNETMSELKQVLEGSCQLMLLKPAVKACMKLMDEFAPQLVEMLLSMMNPQVVCEVAKLCNNPKLIEEQRLFVNDSCLFKFAYSLFEYSKSWSFKSIMTFATKTFSDSYALNPTIWKFTKLSGCVTCQRFITSVAHISRSIPKKELVEEFVNICRFSGTYSDACMYNFLRDPETLLSRSRTAFVNQPCEDIGLCPMKTTESVEKALERLPKSQSWQESKKEMCSVCPTMMENLHFILKGLKTEKALIDWTENLCNKLFLSENVCKKFANEHYQMITDHFKANTSYDYICTHGFGICNEESRNAPIWPLVPSHSLPKVKNFDQTYLSNEGLHVKVIKNEKKGEKKVKLAYGDPLDSNIKETKGEKRVEISFGDPLEHPLVIKDLIARGESCQACTDMFHTVSRYMIHNQGFMDEILNSTCSSTTDSEACMFITSNSAEILSNLIVPTSICPLLVPLCDGKNLLGAPKHKLSIKRNCDFCTNLFGLLNGNDPNINSAKTAVTVGLQSSCQKLPDNNQTFCNEVVDNFKSNLIAAVTADVEKSNTCSHLNLCESEEKVTTVEKVKNSCKDCIMFFEFIYVELNDHSNVNEIQTLLHNLCKKLPKSEKNFCQMVVDNYFQEIIQYIKGNLTPIQICHLLHVCPNHQEEVAVQPVVFPHNALQTSTGSPNKIPCNFCLTALKMLINQIESNKTEEAIKHALDRLCSYMPEEVHDTCMNLVGQYTEDIIDMIIADFNETEICIYLKICNANLESTAKSRPLSLSYSMATNEIWDGSNPSGVCRYCQLIEKSMAVRGYEEKGADGMLGLLADVCMMDIDNLYGHCARKFSEEILPVGKKALLEMTNICSGMKLCPKEETEETKNADKLIERIQSAVQECAMCETIVQIVSKHLKMHADKYDFAGNASILCSPVPRNRKRMCESMLISYAPSIVNLLTEHNVKVNDVCFHLQLCDKSAQTKVNMPVTSLEQSGLPSSDTNECLKGQSFWCASLESAKKCGTVLHCQEMVWKGESP